MHSKSGSCLKLVVILFNAIFLILGLLIIIFGSLVYSQTVQFSGVTSLSATPAVFLMALGGLICVISFLGSCGAFMENYCLLMTFSSIVAIIISAEIVSLGLLYNYRYQLENAVVDGITEAISTYNRSIESRDIVDQLQSQLSCCGASNRSEWKKIFGQDHFPESCCNGNWPFPHRATVEGNANVTVEGNANVTVEGNANVTVICNAQSDGLFLTPCRQAIEDAVSLNVTNLIVTASVFLVVQLLSLIASCSMARSTRKDYYRFV